MKILIVFGSKSDENVFNGIADVFKESNVEYDVRVCSAHRTPNELVQILKEPFSVIISGAGLAAHLPGVVASKVITPIIGVPVNSNYEGLDSLLSIMQMPPGIPVMSVGVDNAKEAAEKAVLMLKNYTSVNIFGDDEEKAVQKATAVLEKFEIPFEMNPSPSEGALNIRFLPLDEAPEESKELNIYVPILPKGDDAAVAALNVLKHSVHGLWVGLNRGENAALAAVKIMNLEGKYTSKLKKYRVDMAEKVMKDDSEVRA